MRLDTPNNRRKTEQAQQALGGLINDVTARGFHGEAWLRLVVKDGSVLEVRAGHERTHREPAEAEDRRV